MKSPRGAWRKSWGKEEKSASPGLFSVDSDSAVSFAQAHFDVPAWQVVGKLRAALVDRTGPG